MEKNLLLILQMIAVLAIAVGCAVKTDDNASVSSDSGKQNFQVQKSDLSKLDSVGCKIANGNVTCDNPGASDQGTTLASSDTLQKNQMTLQNQKKNVDEVRQSIQNQLQGGDFKVAEEQKADNIMSSLASLSVSLATKAALLDGDIETEKRFEAVQGYVCNGTYAHGGAKATIKKMLIYSDNKTDVTYDSDDGATDLSAIFSLKGATRQFSSQFANSQWDDKKTMEQYIQTDGEFVVKSTGSSNLNLSCLKLHSSGVATSFTDRVTEKRQLPCSVTLTMPSAENAKALKYFKAQMSLSLSAEDSSQTTELGNTFADEAATSAEISQLKYGLRLVSNKGLLDFVIYDRKAGTSVIETMTVNSTGSLKMSFGDAHGNGVLLLCGDEAK